MPDVSSDTLPNGIEDPEAKISLIRSEPKGSTGANSICQSLGAKCRFVSSQWEMGWSDVHSSEVLMEGSESETRSSLNCRRWQTINLRLR